MQSSTDEYIALISHGGSSWSYGPENWKLSMTLAAYSKNGGPLITEPTPAFHIAPQQLYMLQEKLPAYSIFRFRTPTKPGNAEGIPVGLLLGFNLTDERFAPIQDELQRPVIYISERLGTLILNREFDWFEGTVQWGDTTVSIRLERPDDAIQMEYFESIIASLFDHQVEWDLRIRRYAAGELLTTKNEDWTNGPEDFETTESFCEKMALTSISILPEDSFIFWFNDSDMFYGHFIHVEGTTTEGPDRAGIAG